MTRKRIAARDDGQRWLVGAKAMAGVAIMLMLLQTAALAQSRTFYDSSGRVSGRSTTGTNGATTYYGADGRVTGRASTNSSGTLPNGDTFKNQSGLAVRSM